MSSYFPDTTLSQPNRLITYASLVSQQALHLASQVVHLWEDGILELRMIPHPGILRANSAHRRIQFVEQLVAKTRGDLGAITPVDRVFLRHHHAAGLLNRCPNRRPIVGR